MRCIGPGVLANLVVASLAAMGIALAQTAAPPSLTTPASVGPAPATVTPTPTPTQIFTKTFERLESYRVAPYAVFVDTWRATRSGVWAAV